MTRNVPRPTMRILAAIFLTVLTSPPTTASAQTHGRAGTETRGRVTDADTGEPLPFAAVVLTRGGATLTGSSADSDGWFSLTALGGDSLTATFLGYETTSVAARPGETAAIRLRKTAVSLAEVRVTASEAGQTQTATTVIGQTAMEHLQPSSLADLMSLLPGGQTQQPQMGKANSISLREVPSEDKDYATSALGTKIMVDGSPMGTDANLQKITDAGQTDADDKRQNVSGGTDLRTIPTDDIESVEVIRGVPSVRYGDLTSGVVNIRRKIGGSPLTIRLKADPYSRLISLGKGVDCKGGWVVSLGAGLLKSEVDPRNRYETFRRVNASARGRKAWGGIWGGTLTWRPSADYDQNIDAQKADPERQTAREDKYESRHARMALANDALWQDERLLVRLRHSMSLSVEETSQRKRVINAQNLYAPSDTTDGRPHDVLPLEKDYVATHKVEGRPFYSNTQATATLTTALPHSTHRLSVGAEWQCNKNYGRGQVFDTRRPLGGTTARRPRSFRSIPATNIVGMFAEDEASAALGHIGLRLTLGLRLSLMAGLPSHYAMSGKVYADPRANMTVELPKWGMAKMDISVSAGRLSKMPTIDLLHPDKLYVDIYELNYWHKDEALRRAIVRTYAISCDAPGLKPAHNNKTELRIGMRIGSHSLSVSAFHENMDDGFRYMKTPIALPYRKYDTSSVGANPTTRPDPSALPYEETARLKLVTRARNGSTIKKDGVEWQYDSPRIKPISTRLSVCGAWLKTTRENSEPEWYQGANATVMGVVVDNVYAGLYDWRQTSVRERATTSFTIESYYDRIGFIFSATAECVWHGKTTTPLRNARPMAYMGIDGQERPYGEAEAKDPILGALTLSNTANSISMEERAYATFNFKATKKFGTYFSISFFADRLLAAARDYEKDGFTVRRSFSPYFGAQAYVRF